jgi:hypothetical protein
MSQQSVLTVKVDAEKKDYINKTINNVSKIKSIENKGDVLYYIIKTYNETSHKTVDVDYSNVKPFECNFLNFQNETWLCLEPMSTTKKDIDLGTDINNIRAKCKACFEGHAFTENERKRKLLERDNIRNLTEFYKDFLAMTKQGFNVDCVMCKGALLEKNTVIMSRDGESLFCPNQNMDLVNINNVCKEVSNTVTKSKGCEYLISLEHHVNFKGSDVDEKIKEILPKLKQLEDNKENE